MNFTYICVHKCVLFCARYFSFRSCEGGRANQTWNIGGTSKFN